MYPRSARCLSIVIISFVVFAFTVLPVTAAKYGTFATVDAGKLPLRNIYDPTDHRNHQITAYSLEELTAFLDNADFRQKNDLELVERSMDIMIRPGNTKNVAGPSSNYDWYDAAQQPWRSEPMVVYVQAPRQVFIPATSRAYVTFGIPDQPFLIRPASPSMPMPPPMPLPKPRALYVDMVYPPWMPTDNVYGADGGAYRYVSAW
jgi:hypothetical protein